MHVLTLRSNAFSFGSQREPLDRMERPVTTVDDLSRGAWEHSGTADDAMLLLPSQFFRHLRALLGNTILYTFYDDKLLRRNAVRQL